MVFDIFLMNVAAVFAAANTLFVLLLIYAYYQSWKKVHSNFTLGLILFAGFFLLQNAVIIVFWYILYELVATARDIVLAASPYLVLINATESIAFGNLVRITWK